MFKIYGLTNDRAKLLAHQAQTDDLEAAQAISDLYVSRGLIARICQEKWNGADEVWSEHLPA